MYIYNDSNDDNNIKLLYFLNVICYLIKKSLFIVKKPYLYCISENELKTQESNKSATVIQDELQPTCILRS